MQEMCKSIIYFWRCICVIFFAILFVFSAKKEILGEEEIRKIHEACNGKILKVIIETCLLTEEEKIGRAHV